MERRRFLVTSAALLVAPLAARAQREARVYRVGFLSPVKRGPRSEALREGLRALGYVEGRNLELTMRFADGKRERLDPLIAELVGMNPDVLVVGSTIGARAAKKATTTIPIVFAGSSDPVAGGIVSNLARPEGNITGFSLAYGKTFAGKWLELLKELVPGVSHYATLWSSANKSAVRFVDELRRAAQSMNVTLDVHHARDLAELDAAFAAIRASDARALIVNPSPFAATHRRRLVGFAARERLPAVYFSESFVKAGGLMSYGPNIVAVYGRAASHVDKILKGARPGDLPVENPTKFDLVVNLKAAKALGIEIAPSIALRADRVIE